MADATPKPVIFLAFANDRDDMVGYLRNLPVEARRLREVLEPAERAGLCEVVVRSNSSAGDIFKVFQDPRYRNRVGIFHYGGHANGYELLLESPEGKAAVADAGGLAAFLAQQQGLQLVFLNGCSTQQQTRELHEANVSVVISTSRSIDDKAATEFADFFYQGLAGGATIRKAYSEASAAIKTTRGEDLRALYFGDADKPEDHRNESGFPWNLYSRNGSENADQWNLPEAVNDPLFGLPPLPAQDLPESPYRHLNWFKQKDAEVFFGRGHKIRELYDRLTAPQTAPIMLFYGQSGVGKSSILDAGLLPRLEQNYEVRYLRRAAGGLLDSLQLAFLPEAADVPIETAWRLKEEQLGKPLIVFLDQIEELYTRPLVDVPGELDQLLKVMQAIFCNPNHRPKGKLVLGFRKEWLAELEAQLVAYELPRTKVFLEPLNRRGVIEIVCGPTRSARLREKYGLTVEDGLAEIIADDLLADHDSAIAPTLQILLTKMWTNATEANYDHPQFTQELYQQLKRDGLLLRDFLNQQIAAFRQRYPEVVDSGLLLDIVALHTTPLGTADQCTVEQVQQQYTHLGATLPAILQQCQDLHLLTVAASAQKDSTKATRLAHDTLAPLVREQFDVSDKPGQRARRILNNRSVDWTGDHVGTPLDEEDLKVVEHGATGTRALSATEQRLLSASRELRARLHRTRRILKIAGAAAVTLIVVVAAVAVQQRGVAVIQRAAAEEALDTGKKAVDEMLMQVGSESLKDVPQMEGVRESLLKKAESFYLTFQEQNPDNPNWLGEQAKANYHLGEMYRVMDNSAAAESKYKEAIEQFNVLLKQSPELNHYHVDLAKTYNKFGYLLKDSNPLEAERQYALAMEQYDEVGDDIKQKSEFHAEEALTLINRGTLKKEHKPEPKFKEARIDFSEAITILDRYEKDDSATEGVTKCRLYLAFAYNNRANLVSDADDNNEGEYIPDYDAAIKIGEALYLRFPNDRYVQSELARWKNNVAGVHLVLAKKYTDPKATDQHILRARELNSEAKSHVSELSLVEPNISKIEGECLITLAFIQKSQKDIDGAKVSIQSARELFEDPVGRAVKQGGK